MGTTGAEMGSTGMGDQQFVDQFVDRDQLQRRGRSGSVRPAYRNVPPYRGSIPLARALN